MHLFIQLQNQETLNFLVSRNDRFGLTHSILIKKREMADFFVDKDNIIYAYGDGTLFKVIDGLLPLHFDIIHIHFGYPTYFISNHFVFKKITDSNFQRLYRVDENIIGISEYNKNVLTWTKTHLFYSNVVIETNTEISFVKVFKDTLFYLDVRAILYKVEDNLSKEIVCLNHSVITDLCFNDFLPVIALLSDKNIFIVDIANKKIVKIIDSFGAQSIKFKNKRSIYLMCTDKVVEYHLGKDIVSPIIESQNSQFFYFDLKNEIQFETDNFKEEVRSKLIENKIENKRMLFKLMNELDDLKAKYQDLKK